MKRSRRGVERICLFVRVGIDLLRAAPAPQRPVGFLDDEMTGGVTVIPFGQQGVVAGMPVADMGDHGEPKRGPHTEVLAHQLRRPLQYRFAVRQRDQRSKRPQPAAKLKIALSGRQNQRGNDEARACAITQG